MKYPLGSFNKRYFTNAEGFCVRIDYTLEVNVYGELYHLVHMFKSGKHLLYNSFDRCSFLMSKPGYPQRY